MVQNASFAVAIKSQHAYNRTLHWQARTPKEAARALAAWLHDRDSFTEEERLCLGDWCTARGVELAIEDLQECATVRDLQAMLERKGAVA